MSLAITVTTTEGERVRIDVDSIKATKCCDLAGGRMPRTDITFKLPDGEPRTVRIAEREDRFLDVVRRLKRCAAKPNNSP